MDKRPSREKSKKSRKSPYSRPREPIPGPSTSPTVVTPAPSAGRKITSRKRRLEERMRDGGYKRRRIEEINAEPIPGPSTSPTVVTPDPSAGRKITSRKRRLEERMKDGGYKRRRIEEINAHFEYSSPCNQLSLASLQQQPIEHASMLFFPQPEDAGWRRETQMDCSEDVFAPTLLDMPNPYYTIEAPSTPPFLGVFIFGNTTQTSPAMSGGQVSYSTWNSSPNIQYSMPNLQIPNVANSPVTALPNSFPHTSFNQSIPPLPPLPPVTTISSRQTTNITFSSSTSTRRRKRTAVRR